MSQPKYNDPFMVVTDHGTTSEVSAVMESVAKEFGITNASYVEVGQRDFGVLGKLVGFTGPQVTA